MHEQLLDADTHTLLEQLPPIKYAPILRHLGHLGLKRFKDLYAIPTPIHANGIVDHTALIEQVSAFVSPEYRWRAPFFDEHHLHWKKYYYNPGFYDGDTLPAEFRNLPIHTLWEPREFHDFTHLMTIPSDVPRYDVMRKSVDTYRLKHHLFKISSQAIALRERDERSIPLPGSEDRVRDPMTKRVIDAGVYERRRQAFIQEIMEHFRSGELPDLSHLSSLSLEEADDIQPMLMQIRKDTSHAIVHSTNRRRGRPVRLPIDTQTIEQPARAA